MQQMTLNWLAVGTLLLAALSGGTLAPTPSLAAPGVTSDTAPDAKPVQDRDPRIDRTWVREWENFAPFYVAFQDTYYCFPLYSPDRQGSSTTTVEDYIRATAYEADYHDEHGRERTYIVAKPVEDAQAALWLLRDPKPGDYGYIHSGAVEQIIDGNELVLRSVILLDGALVTQDRHAEGQTRADRMRELAAGRTRRSPSKQGGRERREDVRQRERSLAEIRDMLTEAQAYRFADRTSALERHREEEFRQTRWHIIGFNTESLVVEERWPQGEAALNGLHLAIVAAEEGRVTAIPAALLGRPLTEVQFLEILESRGYTKAQFVELVNAMRREHRREYIPAVISRLEGLDGEEKPDDAEADGETEPEAPVNDTVELAD